MNIIGIITAAFLTAMSAATGNAVENQPEKLAGYYADCGLIMDEIRETPENSYEITITMQNGNMFSFISEDGDWMPGEIVSAIFYDNGTPEVKDDEIISCRYSGWISDEEAQNWIK